MKYALGVVVRLAGEQRHTREMVDNINELCHELLIFECDYNLGSCYRYALRSSISISLQLRILLVQFDSDYSNKWDQLFVSGLFIQKTKSILKLKLHLHEFITST